MRAPAVQGVLELAGGASNRLEWRREAIAHLGRSDYQMLRAGAPTGYWVRHCGHQTALRPYYVRRPDGTALERKFRLATEAQAAAEVDLGNRARD